MHAPSLPPTVPRSDASRPSPRSGWSRSSASSVLSRRCDFLPPLPPRFVAFAWWYHTVRLGFRSHRPRRNDGGPGVLGSGTPTTEGSDGDGRISQVPGKPRLLLCRALRLRQVGTPLTMTVRPRGPRYMNGA